MPFIFIFTVLALFILTLRTQIFLLHYLNNLQYHQLWCPSKKSAQRISLTAYDRYGLKLAQDSHQLLDEKPTVVLISYSPLWLLSWFSATESDWLQRYWSHILLVIVFGSYIQLNSKFYWLLLIIFCPSFTFHISKDPTRKRNTVSS